jgi:putative transposase
MHWKKSNKAVYNLGYHFIWCPKYRRAVLIGDVEQRLIELLYQKAKDKKMDIVSLEVMPDHVHVFLKTPTAYSPQYVANQLKGYTSRMLRKEFASLKSRLPSLWTRSYYVESVGHISEDTIKKYIADQKNK